MATISKGTTRFLLEQYVDVLIYVLIAQELYAEDDPNQINEENKQHKGIQKQNFLQKENKQLHKTRRLKPPDPPKEMSSKEDCKGI